MDAVEELARDLHQIDRTQGEATGDWVGCDWDKLMPETRSRFIEQAKAHIDAGEWTPSGGWSPEFLEST